MTRKVTKVAERRPFVKPHRYTIEQMCEALHKAHGVQTLAAQFLGCERRTVERYMAKFPAVKQAHDEAPERVTDIAEGHVINAVIRGDLEQSRWWLKTKGRSRGYGDVVKTEVSGENGAPVLIRVIRGDGKTTRATRPNATNSSKDGGK